VAITETSKKNLDSYFKIECNKTVDKQIIPAERMNKDNFRAKVAHWSYLTKP
jgi:hypothetical protein